MGDIGAVAELATVLFKWFTNPDGFQEMTLDKKLEALHDAMLKALAAHDYAAVDQLLAQYRRLSQQSGV